MKNADKYKWRGIGRRIFFGVLFVILAGIFLFYRGGLLKWYELKRYSHKMESQNDSLQGQIDELSSQINALEEGDSLELERVARHWGMAREGEEIYIIKEESDSTAEFSE
ncbi:septum formation initiator family protein [bacterium]|nr:septum formation initiator family protein [bacterium]MBU1651797.1 septum formation initiator family protein [bacterium]MBU1880760.1 septum formation initiator family protein [bacterium]